MAKVNEQLFGIDPWLLVGAAIGGIVLLSMTSETKAVPTKPCCGKCNEKTGVPGDGEPASGDGMMGDIIRPPYLLCESNACYICRRHKDGGRQYCSCAPTGRCAPTR